MPLSFTRKIRSLILARPTGITRECGQGCHRCHQRAERNSRWPYGIVPEWVPFRHILWLPAMRVGPMGRKMLVPISGGAPEPYEGYGATTLGGTGQGTVHVTSSGTGAGSLVAAVQSGASNRRVVFDINGPISWSSQNITGAFVTVDGSTAPGGNAITVETGSEFTFANGANDQIWTYLRIRHAGGAGGADGIGVSPDGDAFNLVFDHLSISDASDGLLDIGYGAHDVTVQYCFFRKAFFAGQTASGACLVRYGQDGTARTTWHHNLFWSNERNPNAAGVADADPTSTELMADVRCNLMWNWGTDAPGDGYGQGAATDRGGTMNVVKNYMRTSNTGQGGNGIELGHNVPANCQMYTVNNTSGTSGTSSATLNAVGNVGSPIGSPAAITEHVDAITAAAYVLACAGARPLDAYDTALVNAITPNIPGLPTVTCTGSSADTTPPTITIMSPTTLATLSSTTEVLTLAGTASDDTGVTSVTWSNDRGGNGTATGTTTWAIAAIPLALGVNVITVTASDAAANASQDTLTVTYHRLAGLVA